MMETINDIVREMRTLGRLDEKSTDKIPRSLQALGLRTYADRLEAAIKREIENAIAATVKAAAQSASEVYEPHIQSEPVGNAAKMREALEWLLGFGYTTSDDDGFHMPDAKMVKNKIYAALSAPPRNCDLYTKDEVRLVYHLHGDGLMTMQAFSEWLFAEAKGDAK